MSRKSAVLTTDEVSAYEKFCKDHNIVCDGSEVGVANGTLIGEYITVTWGEEITPVTLAIALEKLRDRVTFKSAAQREIESIASGMTENEKSITREFLKKQGRLVLDGDQGSENISNIVSWLRARSYPISAQNLVLALSNILNSGGRKLHWLPEPARTEPYGRHSKGSRSFAPKSETNRSFTDTIKDHSKDPAYAPKSQESSLSADEARWMGMANALVGRTHGQTAEAMRIVKATPRETYEARKKFLDGRGASI
jgi:hypothetical protein